MGIAMMRQTELVFVLTAILLAFCEGSYDVGSRRDEKYERSVERGDSLGVAGSNLRLEGWEDGREEGSIAENGQNAGEDDFYIDPIIARGSPSYRLNKMLDGLSRRLASSSTSDQGSNCLEVGGGYSPAYSLCDGCMISEALQCVDDMRHNVSMNVRPACDLSAMLVEPQPSCCTKFGFPDTGKQIDPETSAYNDALLCLEISRCKCLDGTKECKDTDMHDVYKNLRDECNSHTVHEDCRTSCDVWIHDGAEPIGDRTTGDCREWDPVDRSSGGCWEYLPQPSPPVYHEELPQCEPASEAFKRWRDGGSVVNGRVEVRAEYDWWYCWYSYHCLFADGRRKYPPLKHEDTNELLTAQNCTTMPCTEAYGVECSAAQQKEHDEAIADGRTPDFDCDPGGIPQYCDTSFDTTLLADGTVKQEPRGILIPPDTVVKYENINCKVDKFACEPTVSGTVGAWWKGWEVTMISFVIATAAAILM